MVQIPNFNASTRQWSTQQEAIFEWFQTGIGNLLVRARAGTGKTTTLLEGVERAPERRICVAAFNKAIALELQNRVRSSSVKAMTLHGLGLRFIKRAMPQAEVETGGERARSLARAGAAVVQKRSTGAESASGYLIQKIATFHTQIREILGDPLTLWPIEEVGQKTIEWITTLESFTDDAAFYRGFWTLEHCVEAALEAVVLAKEPTTTVDFADMLFLPLACGFVVPIYDLMVVDEAQDMSKVQLDLALAACDGRIVLVGDDRQAIYGFRGADVGCLDRLKAQLGADEMGLTVTYRCPWDVVRTANVFVPDLRAHEDAPAGTVNELVAKAEMYKYAEAGDFVLSRANAPLVEACLEFIRSGKCAYIKGREFGKRAIQLADKLGCKQLGSLRKALEQWYEQNVARIRKASKDPDRVAAKIAQIVDDYEVLDAFIVGSKSYSDLNHRLQTSFSDEPKPDAVMCSTVHKAKGLETNVVWLLGKTFHTNAGEEQNICYVAVTRSKSVLHIVERARFKPGDDEENLGCGLLRWHG